MQLTGVSYRNGKYTARYKRVELGTFKNLHDAIEARKRFMDNLKANDLNLIAKDSQAWNRKSKLQVIELSRKYGVKV